MKNCIKGLFILFSILGQSQICPLKEGNLIVRHFDIFSHTDSKIVEINSNYADVFSVSDGEVVSIINLSHIYSVIIKKEMDEDQYYVYSNLSTTTVKKGDVINSNQLLGKAIQEGGKYSINFQHRILSEKSNPKKVINCRELNIYY